MTFETRIAPKTATLSRTKLMILSKFPILFQVVFLAKLDPLSVTHFMIKKDAEEKNMCSVADVVVYNYNSTVPSK